MQIILLLSFICLGVVVCNFLNYLAVIVKAFLLSFVCVILKTNFGTTELNLKNELQLCFLIVKVF